MHLEINSSQTVLDISERAIRDVVRTAFRLEGLEADVSVMVVDDGQITELNRRFLGRARTTDVLAFPYEQGEDCVNGEIVVNAEMALREAQARPHSTEDELLLYVAHGALHLLGYDDHEPHETQRMRRREQQVLSAAGRKVQY